jgi:nucleotide-binding universal stress UspA family protein
MLSLPSELQLPLPSGRATFDVLQLPHQNNYRCDTININRAALRNDTVKNSETTLSTPNDVLVVPRGASIEGKGMVLPVDGSRYSDAAATVINLAKQCQTKVTVVSVATDEHLRGDADALAKRIQTQMAEAGVKADVDVRVGLPDEGIVACAKERDADLIIMGSHSRTGLDRLLIGSISERVIGRAECPVMVVKL